MILSSRKRRGTISWKAIFVVAMMTLFSWGQNALDLSYSFAPTAADETVITTGESKGDEEAPEGAADSDAAAAEGPAETTADADDHGGGHKDPVAEVLLAILIILLLAKVSGDLFERVGMPAVLGELTVGILLGNWALFTGSHVFDFFKPEVAAHIIPAATAQGWDAPNEPTKGELRAAYEELVPEEEHSEHALLTIAEDKTKRVWHRFGDEKKGEELTWAVLNEHEQTAIARNLTGTVLDMLARIGVVLLLFEVGLESRVKEMASVGLSSFLVAILGVVAPMALGFGVGYALVSESSADWQVPAFLGATLCATSVGITARVLKDLGKSQAPESKIILGAAVIDDVLGLVVLAVVSGVIAEGDNFQISSLFKIVGLSFAFLAGALVLGACQFPRMLFRAASFLRGHGLLVTTALMICFFFSWGANVVGLAPIIGAFAAGLILEGAHYQEVGEKWKNHHLEDALAPISALLVPIFFVATGISVDLSQFSGGSVWVLAIGLTIAAIIGKQVCSFGVREAGLNKLAVGLGMIPRGEVGLIFAQEGQRLITPEGERVVNDATFSAIVVMVMVTTMITPPLLKWAMSKPTNAPADDDGLPASE